MRNGCSVPRERKTRRISLHVGALAAVATLVPMWIGGCTGMVNGQNKTGEAAVQVLPAVLDFGNTGVGKKVSHVASVTNNGDTAVTLTEASVTSEEFSITGLQFPISIQSGQKANFTVWFNGSKAGKASGTFSFKGSKGPTPPVVVTGSAGSSAPQLSLSGSSHDFGSVTINTVQKAGLTLTNSGASTLTISAISASGAPFSTGRVKLPAKIAAGANILLDVDFSPKTAGNYTGAVSISSNDPENPTSIVSLTGVATTAAIGKLTASPTTLTFSNVKAGSFASAVTTLKNAGNTNVTLSQINTSSPLYVPMGIVAPVLIVPGESVALTVKFSPTAAGTSGGVISLINTQGGITSVSATGTAVAAPSTSTAQPQLTVSPASISFGSVVAGLTNSQTVQVANPGSASLTISAANFTGSGFSALNLSLPMTLGAGQSSTFNVQFNPKTSGAATGGLSLVSNAPNSPSAITLSGTGVAAGLTLSVNPSSISFGNVTVGSSASRSVTVTNSGNSNVAISAVNLTGSNLVLSGGSAVNLTPSQSITLTVQFSPSAASSTVGAISIVSNASGSPAAVPITGTGVAQVQHTVNLSWNASTSAAGYNVYRSVTSGGGYSRINSTLNSALNYSDSTVQNSQAYFYVTTAVDNSGNESAYSTEVSVNIP